MIVIRAPHWRLHHLSAESLTGHLTKLVQTLLLKVWTDRSKDSYVESGVGGVPCEPASNKRAKVQRWSSVLSAWRALLSNVHREL